MKTEIGELIVGAYLKQRLGCDVVDYNVRPPSGGLAGLAEFDVIGLEKMGSRQRTRLKTHYVAMTRPTHILCLAMRRSVFLDNSGQLDAAKVKLLEERGWNVMVIE